MILDIERTVVEWLVALITVVVGLKLFLVGLKLLLEEGLELPAVFTMAVATLRQKLHGMPLTPRSRPGARRASPPTDRPLAPVPGRRFQPGQDIRPGRQNRRKRRPRVAAARAPRRLAPAGGGLARNDSTEREQTRRALEAADGDVSAAARALGLERTALHKRLRALGLGRGGGT